MKYNTLKKGEDMKDKIGGMGLRLIIKIELIVWGFKTFGWRGYTNLWKVSKPFRKAKWI